MSVNFTPSEYYEWVFSEGDCVDEKSRAMCKRAIECELRSLYPVLRRPPYSIRKEDLDRVLSTWISHTTVSLDAWGKALSEQANADRNSKLMEWQHACPRAGHLFRRLLSGSGSPAEELRRVAKIGAYQWKLKKSAALVSSLSFYQFHLSRLGLEDLPGLRQKHDRVMERYDAVTRSQQLSQSSTPMGMGSAVVSRSIPSSSTMQQAAAAGTYAGGSLIPWPDSRQPPTSGVNHATNYGTTGAESDKPFEPDPAYFDTAVIDQLFASLSQEELEGDQVGSQGFNQR